MFDRKILVVMITATIMSGCSAIADNKTFDNLPVDLEGNNFARVESGGSINEIYGYSIAKINGESRPFIARSFALPANKELTFSVSCYDKNQLSDGPKNSFEFHQTLQANRCYRVIGASTKHMFENNIMTTDASTGEKNITKSYSTYTLGLDFCNAVKLKEVECTPDWSYRQL